jgi:hypothetical protein|tara:strand:+ start:415 stop:549 length:135 start_codon:yes stop_codon:yes gene_type:complete
VQIIKYKEDINFNAKCMFMELGNLPIKAYAIAFEINYGAIDAVV